MTQDDLLHIVLPYFALPPGPSIVLLFLALLSQRPRTRMFFLILGLGTLYLTSIPATSNWLMGRLEVYPPVSLDKSAAEAIVVLGADRRRNAPEYGGDTMNRLGLERLRYAAKLGKMTGLPILASGGVGQESEGEVPEAELMNAILREFGVEANWLEGKSQNTYENALFSSQMLKGVGIGEILLVTHAWHMPRAIEAFERAGMRVTPAPTGLMNPNHKTDFQDFLPSASALQSTFWALHEMLGRWWYHYRYYSES
ncbi:MAG: YdcF family protein [Proteobacteria bacterium]|nr:YdcF family protein [Pseudomonadota bacterium]